MLTLFRSEFLSYPDVLPRNWQCEICPEVILNPGSSVAHPDPGSSVADPDPGSSVADPDPGSGAFLTPGSGYPE